jgi:hypothetical protein
MNERQAEALRRLMEAGHPDAAVTVTAQRGGARVVMSGPGMVPGTSGPGTRGPGTLRLCLGDDSPFTWLFLASHAD